MKAISSADFFNFSNILVSVITILTALPVLMALYLHIDNKNILGKTLVIPLVYPIYAKQAPGWKEFPGKIFLPPPGQAPNR
jgi:hypothetical protein